MEKVLLTEQKLAYMVLAVGFVASVLSAVLTPPFNVLDGKSHWLRMVQISTGGFFPETLSENKYGGNIPNDAHRLSQLAMESFRSGTPMQGEDFRRWSVVLANADHTPNIQAPFSNTAIHPPLPYMPGALALKLGRWFHLEILDQYFLACIFSAAAFYGIMMWAVRLSLGLHLGIAALATAPSVIFLSGSVSGDPLNLALPTLFFVWCWRLREGDGLLNGVQYIALGAGMFALALLKTPMILFASFAMFIPRSRFGEVTALPPLKNLWLTLLERGKRERPRLVKLLLVGAPALVFWIWWRLSLPFDFGAYFGWENDPAAIKAQILSAPLSAFALVWENLLLHPFWLYSQSLIFAGGHGNGFAIAGIPGFSLGIMVLLVWSALAARHTRPSLWLGLFAAMLAFVYAIGLFFGFWIELTAPGVRIIAGVHPRYFLVTWLILAGAIALAFGGRLPLPKPGSVAALVVTAINLAGWALSASHLMRLWQY